MKARDIRGHLAVMVSACMLMALLTVRLYADDGPIDAYTDDDSYTRDDTYYRGDDYYYRDNYYWDTDFARDAARKGLTKYLTSFNVYSDGWVNSSHVTRQMRIAADNSNTGNAFVRIVNGEFIRQSALISVNIAALENGKTAILYADTMLPSNNNFQTRMYIDVAKFVGDHRDLKLGVFSDNEWIYEAKQDYLDRFTNHIELIRFAERDSFPTAVKVDAVVDLSKMDRNKLLFYSYNRVTDEITQIKNPNYSFNKQGKLVFWTRLAGDILITDRTLVERVKSNGWISEERIRAEEEAEAAAAAAAAEEASK